MSNTKKPATESSHAGDCCSPGKSESSDALKEAADELGAARDAARLKLHLLSMDARKTWDELESRVQAVQQELSGEGEKVAAASATAARDLARSIRKFVEHYV